MKLGQFTLEVYKVFSLIGPSRLAAIFAFFAVHNSIALDGWKMNRRAQVSGTQIRSKEKDQL